ncbi:MAG: Crp/Fnr family transcriptional regulator [Anaerolineae bacterium]
MKKRIGYLSVEDIFRDLGPQEREEIERSFTEVTFRRDEVIYTPEKEILFLLKRGTVQLYRLTREGEKQVVDTLGPGTIFGEMPLIGQGMYSTFAQTVEDCTLGTMERTALERLLLQKPTIALRILEGVGKRLSEAESLLEDVTFKGGSARLASLLLRLMKEQGPTIAGYTHQDLADTIGTYRETTTQTLGRFKRQGLIRIGRKRLQILDVEGLREIAEK